MDVYTRLEPSTRYKLLELTPELTEILKQGSEPLSLKASSVEGEIVLCLSDATFQVRQKNHTNTLLLMTHTDAKLEGFASLESQLELTKVKGRIELLPLLPLYAEFGQPLPAGASQLSVQELMQRSPVSDGQFRHLFMAVANGSEVEGCAVVLTREFVTRTLGHLLTTLLALELDQSRLEVEAVVEAIGDPDYTPALVRTLLWKFSTAPETTQGAVFALDPVKVSQWYGINALQTFAQRVISPTDFLIHWKSVVPPFFECPIDLAMLAGHFVRPLLGKIQYVCLEGVLRETDPIKRFKMLFKLQGLWDINEIGPFIDDLNLRGLKRDTFVIKYAKRKQIGKRVVVTSR